MATDDDLIYPPGLSEAERALIWARRGVRNKPPAQIPHRVGIALSGGGIRSATFSLGVFQALARAKLLRHVDFLSTVSGGGYFGGFFAGLFARNDQLAKSAEEVEEILTGKRQPDILSYLRENGRYLAPGGSDDLLLGGAVLLRNWLALQLVLWSFALLGFLGIHVVGSYYLAPAGLAAGEWPFASEQVWLSPCVWLGAAVLVGGAVPLGAGYWMIGPYGTPRRFNRSPLLNALFATALPLSIAWMKIPAGIAAKVASWYLPAAFVVMLFALRFAAMSTWRRAWTLPWAGAVLAWFAVPIARGYFNGASTEWTLQLIATLSFPAGLIGWAATSAFQENTSDIDDVASYARFNISEWLKVALIVSAVMLAVGVLDSVGRTLYWYLSDSAHRSHRVAFAGSVAALVSGVASLTALAQRIGAMLPSKPDGKRPGWLLGAAARVAAMLVLSVGLIITATLAAGIASGFGQPCVAYLGELRGIGCALRVVSPLLIGTALALALCLLFAFARVFINRSSHHALYSARITRAYLGASNPARAADVPDKATGAGKKLSEFLTHKHGLPDLSAATRVMSGDDIPPGAYWKWPTPATTGPYSRGAPLHLINVTINETVDGRSQIQQADRKGLGMALGPCGVSVGASHHAVFEWQDKGDSQPKYCESGHHVFNHAAAAFPAEPLSIGAWLGISGAAFSTGLGFRTNFGFSILAGLANIRLGYWWKPGVRRRLTINKMFGALFWVQSYLLRELLARFPGTANALWYLSDGGHFENLGAYELIRRRVEFMLLIDAEADADYQFESMGNLVRKARIDFGAEIEFLSNAALADKVHGSMLERFGTLDQLRRGTWVKGLIRVPPPEVVADKVWELESAERAALSLATTALARVTYADGKVCWLMYVKPTLTGKEPADVMRYHTEHPDFPHEGTGDQFFDEAQWESYRKLGEHIGGVLFPEEPVLDPDHREPRCFFTGKHSACR